MSKRNSSEYDIYVNLENEKGGDVPIPKLVSTLKRQFSYIKIQDDGESKNKIKIEEKVEIAQQPNEVIDTENSEVVNLNGEVVRKSWAIFSRN